MEEFRIVLADACKIVKESSRKRVISGADEDGRVMVEFSEPVGGRRVKMLTPDEINGMLYKEETAENPADMTEENPTGEQDTEQERGTTEESAFERIPKDEEGNPQYTQTDAPTAWDAIVEQTEGDEDMARSVVDSTVRDKEAALKKLESSNPKPGATVAEKIAAAKEHKAAIEAARQELEQWKAIAEVENSRKAEAEAKAKAEEEEAKAKAKAEEERTALKGVNLSEEKDENGNSFVVSSDGTTTFGEVRDKSGLPAAPIKLSVGYQDKNGSGYGLTHIEANHGVQIKKEGFASVEDFVSYVAKNYDENNIKVGKRRTGGSITYLLQVTGKHDNTLFIELSRDGSYWNVNSAGVFRKGYSDKKETVAKTEPQQPSNAISERALQSADQSNGILPASPNGKPTVSTSKVSESPETKQEKAEKSISAKVKEASADVNTEPTEAQREAGNYKKGHVQVGAFDITIEQPEGSIRRGTDAAGKQWESKRHNTYGYIRGTEGVDGDHIDVFLSNDIDVWNGRKVYVVDQYNPDGTFDEHKVMLGFNDMDEAKGDYLANYEKGWENGRRIDVSAVNLEDFEKWIASSHRKTKPFSEYKSVKPAGDRETFNGHKVENSGKDIEAQIKHLEEIKDYPGADKKIVQSEIDRLKAKEEAKAKSKSKEENGVDDAKIEAVSEALSKGDEKAEQLVQGLTSRELSKLRSKVKASPLLENEWLHRVRTRDDVSLHDRLLENQYVEPVKRVSGTFKMTDYIAPKNVYEGRLSGVYHDDKGYAVATDGRILVADKGSYDPKLKGKIIGKDGAAMENKFPNWQKVIPTAKETKSSRIDAEDLHRFVAGVLKADKHAYISLRFPDGTTVSFHADKLNLMLRAMKRLGADKLLYAKDGSRLVAKSDKGAALLMWRVSAEDESMEEYGYAYDKYRKADLEREKANNAPETNKTGAFGTIYTQFKGKAKEAIAFLLEKKEGEAVGALHHKDIGDIDLVWGKEGTGKSDGFGLAKLVKYHPEVLDDLQEILDDMTVVKKNANRVQLESKTHKASVRLAWDKEKKNWLLTAYEKKNSASDNTTDTAETAMSGKRNDTATPQNTVSMGKVSESSETKQEKKEKSEEDRQNPISDVGEKISGARKDLLRDFSNKLKETTLESLITLPFSKAFKRPDLKTAVEQGLLRQRDARFAEAVMATYLSKNKPRLLSGWKKGESQKNLEAWAKDAYFGVQTLRALFEADETTRDKLIDEILSAKAYREDDIDRRKKQLEEWNPGKKFEGKCYPLNPMAVYMAVYERLGYDNIGEFKLPVSGVGSSTFFDHYELTDNSGKKIYPTRALQSFEDVVDEITYLSKVKNADEDTDHPNSIFRLAGINPVWESTGWRVLTLGTSSSKRPETHLFKTKEEAEKFAEEYKAGGKYRQASTPIENKELIGYGNYELRFHLGEKDISTGLTFSSKKDARAAIDTEHEKLNAIVNEKLAKARESGGKNEKRPQKDYVRIQAYTEDGKAWKYAVVLDERYAPKSTAFNTLPYSLANGFSTRKEAVAYIEKHRVEWDAKIDDINRRRKDFVFLNGSSERVGEDYRKGEDITAEQFREQFGFRGVQFGNWTNQKDRQAALNNAFDSFMDLAKILGISPKAVSLNGELGIAFGARGGGGAKAHYEREEVVINLTKTMGAGSLAHEWWHALDNYFARRGNVKLGMVTEGKGIAMRGELRKAYDKLVSDTENSDYNRRSRDAGASYWGTRREETARMFAMWVFDEISKKGERNSFLTDNDPAAEERYAKGNYDFYVLMCGQDRPPMAFEEFRKSPSALTGYVYPSQQELEEFGADLRKIFDTVQERVDEETGNTVLYHRGEVVSEMSQEERVLRDAVIDRLRESGMEVITDERTGQRVLDEANGKAKLSAKKRRALETVSASHDEKHQPTVVSSADGAKETATIAENSTNKATGISDAFANVQTNLENLARVYAEKVTNKTRGFITDLSKALKLTQHEASNYGSFALPNGETLAIRISNHNARVSNFDKNDENNGISIVISSHKNKGLNNDGKAHIIEYFYHRRAIENATGKPLADIVKSIEQALYSGEFKDITGLAQRQEVNAETIREHRVYHGSGADFDAFDHSHMGEGEGAQAYGWGTYVTEVEGIGRTYAEQNAQDVSPTEEDFEMMNAAISEKVLERFGGIDAELRVDYDGDGGFNLLDVPNNKEVLVKFRKYFENHPDEFDGYIEDYDLDDEYGRRDFADAVSASMLDFARKVAEDYKDKYWPTKQRILYTVEIPNDNGGNYLDWVAQTGSGLVTRIREALRADEGLNGLYESRKSELNTELEKFAPGMPFYETYTQLGDLLGSDKAASELLSSLGFAGIKYPADNMRGGREDGAKNYVIFNEKDARITDHVRFFRTESGEAYGFTVGGKIYIDPKIANTETPIHEYAHLWAAALRGQNPKEWQNIVELMKGTSVWDEVKKRYPELNTDDDIADEVLATYSGRRGAERLREEQRKIAGDKGGVFEKAEAISALERVKQALRKFWKSVADFLHIHYKSAEEVADRVMKDLLDGVDPGKHFNSRMDESKSERIEKLRESKPVEITGDEYKGKYELNRESAKEWLKNNLRGEYRIKDTGETVELRKDGIQKVTSHSMGNEAHLKSLAAIPQMIENSIFIDEVPNEKNNGKYDRYRYYVCGLKIGGEDYTAKITIGVKGGYKYYDHSLTQIEKGSLLDNIDALSTTYDDKGTTLSSVGKDSRLLSILQVKDEKKPSDGLYRVGSGKELRDGRKIEFVRKPTATYNALARHLQAEGIKPDMHEARTGSRYMSFEKDGVQWEVRSSDHTKPEYYGEAQKPVELTYYKDKQGEENLSVSVDLGTSGYNIEDMKALMAEIDRLKNDAGEVKESFDKGVVSDEAAKRYPLLSQALGVKSENEVRAKEEAREHAEEARKQEMRSAVEDMAGKLHLNNVDIVDKPAGRGAGRRERAKGMFERSTGRITINIGNCADKRDAVVTLLHEAVAHHGLRKLFGENFETFLDNVYNSANAEIRRIIDKHSSRYGGDKRTATEEYMASLAERTDFENAKKSGWWQRIKDFFLKMLEKIGLKGFKGEDLSDNELRYVLWRSYENLKSGGKDTVISAADDLAKQSELKVGEFAPDAKKTAREAKKTAPEENTEEVNERFNEQLGGLTADNADKVVLSLGRPSKVLLSAGVENKPMTLYGNKVIKKMRKHGFALEELRNLPRAVADPIAVFNNYGENGNRSILTELKTLRGNFLVSVNIGKGADVDFNIVSSVFGKGSGNVADWINKGYMTYVDKEKALNYLHHSALRAVTSDSSRLSSEDPAVLPHQSAPIAATAANAEFSSAAKVVENFENPKSESKNDILFRDGDAKDYEKAQARETYERRVSTGMFQSREAIQDSMLSLKVAMDAIEEATAGKAKRIEDYDGFENAYLGENRLSSVNQAESAAFAHLLIRPMMEEVNRLAPTAEDRAELIDYMFAKHGLERNAYMRQQAAEKKLAEYKKQNPGTAKTAADFIDSERDYAGLTTLTGEADVSAAEAEAQRMVADYEKDYTFHGI